MENYKSGKTLTLGDSDIASLTIRTPATAMVLKFGEDGSYKAHLCDDKCQIPEDYELRVESEHWLKIYDDSGLTARIYADKIKIYRRGNFGCIIATENLKEIQGQKF